MDKERLKEIKKEAAVIMAEISDKGYTVAETLAIISFIQLLGDDIKDNALDRAATRECFPDAAHLNRYFF